MSSFNQVEATSSNAMPVHESIHSGENESFPATDMENGGGDRMKGEDYGSAAVTGSGVSPTRKRAGMSPTQIGILAVGVAVVVIALVAIAAIMGCMICNTCMAGGSETTKTNSKGGNGNGNGNRKPGAGGSGNGPTPPSPPSPPSPPAGPPAGPPSGPPSGPPPPAVKAFHCKCIDDKNMTCYGKEGQQPQKDTCESQTPVCSITASTPEKGSTIADALKAFKNTACQAAPAQKKYTCTCQKGAKTATCSSADGKETSSPISLCDNNYSCNPESSATFNTVDLKAAVKAFNDNLKKEKEDMCVADDTVLEACYCEKPKGRGTKYVCGQYNKTKSKWVSKNEPTTCPEVQGLFGKHAGKCLDKTDTAIKPAMEDADQFQQQYCQK